MTSAHPLSCFAEANQHCCAGVNGDEALWANPDAELKPTVSWVAFYNRASPIHTLAAQMEVTQDTFRLTCVKVSDLLRAEVSSAVIWRQRNQPLV